MWSLSPEECLSGRASKDAKRSLDEWQMASAKATQQWWPFSRPFGVSGYRGALMICVSVNTAGSQGAAWSAFPGSQHAGTAAAKEKTTHVCMWDDSSRFLSYLFMPLSSLLAPAFNLAQTQWRVKDVLWIRSSSFIFLCSSSQLVSSLDAH